MNDESFYRPVDWDDYVGQPKLKQQLQVAIKSALFRVTSVDHILLSGPPGCGKTTLGQIVANSMYASFLSFIMPVKPAVLRQIVSSFSGVVLFDEIHRCTPKQQEELLPLIESGYIQLDNGSRIESNKLTVIGATTERDKIIKPLWDRFIIKPNFEQYSDHDMSLIIQGTASHMGISMSDEDAIVLSRATGGVPRVAKSIVAMSRDLRAVDFWNDPDVESILKACRITNEGLHEDHLDYLHTVDKCGGSAGLDTISTHLRLPKPVILDLERLLIQREMITFTKGGRELLSEGYRVLQNKD